MYYYDLGTPIHTNDPENDRILPDNVLLDVLTALNEKHDTCVPSPYHATAISGLYVVAEDDGKLSAALYNQVVGPSSSSIAGISFPTIPLVLVNCHWSSFKHT